MAYSKHWLADLLRHLGYSQAADEALRELPEEFDREQLEEFADRHNLSRDDVISRMGGSP